ncbi:MAG: uncharacterized protein KVP18_001641 [Porospora cf. gigantea A]|uniref:uncharacterized protein n=1 Tax=Porospora cf. gigantea A TaxID=2853593 RepID=UPI00355A0FB2|nr:MAG: hypothetical protein KVP18_001641 [Porospora cf. gigantea A]
MELATGGDLAAYMTKVLDKMPRLPVELLIDIGQQLTSMIHECHSVRVVHGDIKPANFVITEGADLYPDKPVLKLIDFGIADEVGGNTTHILRETMVGSLHYMSPETCQPDGGKQTLSRAADIWSLGIILYRISLGQLHVQASHIEGKKAKKNPTMLDMVKFLSQAHDPENLESEPVQVPQFPRLIGSAERVEQFRGFVQGCVRWKPADRAKTTDLLAHPLFTKPRLDVCEDAGIVIVSEERRGSYSDVHEGSLRVPAGGLSAELVQRLVEVLKSSSWVRDENS